jgi:hypothetical protein
MLWLAVLVSLGATTAVGQGTTGQGRSSGYAKIRGPCQADYAAHCSGSTVEPACLRQYWSNLSKKCQAALQQREAGGGEEKQ